MSILIIDNYDSFTFNLYQMLQAETDLKVIVKRNDAITLNDILELKPKGIVLSPGPGHPANVTDFGVCAEVIKNAETLKIPLLGVCLGHQGIGHYLGGKVSRAPEIIHGKMSNVTITSASKLFAGLEKNFQRHALSLPGRRRHATTSLFESDGARRQSEFDHGDGT